MGCLEGSLEETFESKFALAIAFVDGLHMVSGAKGILRKGDKCKIKDLK